MINNKKIAIFGFANEGIATANYLGKNNEITLIDDKNKNEIPTLSFDKLKVPATKFIFGLHSKIGEDFDLVVRSPGVKLTNPKLLNILKKGTKLTSATKIFFDEFKGTIIGVTGTKGKGTTSTLIKDILKQQFKSIFLGGNIGTPALDFLDQANASSYVVLELSSFQLIDLEKSPHVAVVLMTTSEHLDWHQDITEYLQAKRNIVKYQSPKDFALISKDYPNSSSFAGATKAKTFYFSRKKIADLYLEGDNLMSQINGQEIICKKADIRLPGEHNIENVLAAASVGIILGISREKIKNAISKFDGLLYRLQKIKTVEGVTYYNDSFSTTPETTIAAIKSFKNPKILILGGSSKNSDFTQLARVITSDKTIKAIILIGSEGQKIKQVLEKASTILPKMIEGVKNMEEIVDAAQKIAQENDVVLLSPACASFGMFKNYKDRGEQFTKEVMALK